MKINYISNICDISELTLKEVLELERVTREFPFGSNTHYLSLIDLPTTKAIPVKMS